MKLWYCSILYHSTVVRAKTAKDAEELARSRGAEYGWGKQPCSVRELDSEGPPEVLVEVVE